MPTRFSTVPAINVAQIAAIVLALAGAMSATRSNAADEKPQLAFPGAEGFGRFAKGGRGGDVFHVTSLADDGPGSLRAGIQTANGPQTIVFDTSGTILLKTPLVVDKSLITIAGQTAPGGGICLRDQTFRIKKASHIIIRYIHFRLGDQNKPRPSGDDCLNTDDVDQVMLDHISVTWGIDGNHDLRRGGNVTLQWSIYAEALHHSIHEKGPHAMLASFRDLTAGITLHHNLFASSRERHPTLGGSPHTDPNAIVDFRNNVIYNVVGATNIGNCRVNLVNNYFCPGPDTPRNHHPLAIKAENQGATRAFLAGNWFDGAADLNQDNYRAIDFSRWSKGTYLHTTLADIRADTEFALGENHPRTDTAAAAYEAVLNKAGASLVRDSADARLVQGVRDRTHHMIDSQDEVGGWPELASTPAPADRDGDGMPDEWESQHGLDPANAADGRGDRDTDGFTNLEEYLNSLVGG